MLARLARGGGARVGGTLFTNPTPITIPDEGPASPYPSEIAVSGLIGPITDMSVTLHRFGHTYPADVDILLVSPGGEGVVLMSDACGGADIEDFTWTFSDSAPARCPDDCSGFVYKPTNVFGDHDPWQPPAPPGPYSNSLSAFDNEAANGTWKLYVIDDATNDSGDIERGWSLSIQTGPVDVTIPANGASGTASTSGPAEPLPGHPDLLDLTGPGRERRERHHRRHLAPSTRRTSTCCWSARRAKRSS